MICPVCASSSSRTLFYGIDADNPSKERVAIKRCDKCKTAFSDVAMSASDGELYKDGYYGEAVSSKAANSFFISLFQKERRATALSNLEGKRIIDIGCGDGTFLASLDGRWEVYGSEPSKPGRAALKAKGIKNIGIGELQGKEYESFFDVVTMWQSLEHVDKPQELLSTVHKILKPGGLLFASVPNFSSLQSCAFGARWFHLDPRRHLAHYTRETLLPIVDGSGFEARSVGTLSFEYGVFGWWQSLFNAIGLEFNMGYKILKKRGVYDYGARNVLNRLAYALLGLPFLAVALVLSLVEAGLGRGGVLNVKAVKRGGAK